MKSFTSTSITTKLFSIFSIASLTLVSTGARAQLVKLTCNNPAALIGGLVPCSQLYTGLQDNVNSKLPAVETGQYTKGIANANAMASAGTGVVYGASYSYALLGGGLGLGVDLGKGNSISKVISGDFDAKKFAGFGAQGSALVGLNPGAFLSEKWFGVIEPSRLRVYLSFMSLSRDFDAINLEFRNFGLVGQYRLIQEKSWGLNVLKWGGVDISSGLKYSKLEAGLQVDLNESFTQSGQTISVAGPVKISADSSNFSIPIEASSSLRILYVLNFIGGLGADVNMGKTSGKGAFSAAISGPPGSEGSGEAKVGSDSSPGLVNLRGFAGAAFEFAVGSLYANVQKSLTAGVWGVNLGVNLFW